MKKLTSELTDDFTFANGTIIKPDGTVIKNEITKIKLEEGEGLDWNGDLLTKRSERAKRKSVKKDI